MFYYLIENHMQKFRHFGGEKKFTRKSHLRLCCTKPFNYCDFVVCGFNEQISLFCERILPGICHQDSVVPRLNHFLEIFCPTKNHGKMVYPEKKLSQPSSDLSFVCFCRMNTTEAVITCRNKACPISTFRLTCLKVQMVPRCGSS